MRKAKRRRHLPLHPVSLNQLQAQRPIVLTPKKAPRYQDDDQAVFSSGLEGLQHLARALSRTNRHLTGAVARGAKAYDKEQAASAREKKDGLLRDVIPNMGEAWSVTLEASSDLPRDVSDIVNTSFTRRLIRRQFRLAARTLRRLGL